MCLKYLHQISLPEYCIFYDGRSHRNANYFNSYRPVGMDSSSNVLLVFLFIKTYIFSVFLAWGFVTFRWISQKGNIYGCFQYILNTLESNTAVHWRFLDFMFCYVILLIYYLLFIDFSICICQNLFVVLEKHNLLIWSSYISVTVAECL